MKRPPEELQELITKFEEELLDMRLAYEGGEDVEFIEHAAQIHVLTDKLYNKFGMHAVARVLGTSLQMEVQHGA